MHLTKFLQGLVSWSQKWCSGPWFHSFILHVSTLHVLSRESMGLFRVLLRRETSAYVLVRQAASSEVPILIHHLERHLGSKSLQTPRQFTLVFTAIFLAGKVEISLLPFLPTSRSSVGTTLVWHLEHSCGLFYGVIFILRSHHFVFVSQKVRI